MFNELSELSIAIGRKFDLSLMSSSMESIVTKNAIADLCNARLIEFDASGLSVPKHLLTTGSILFQTDHHSFGFGTTKDAPTEMVCSMNSSGIYKNISPSSIFVKRYSILGDIVANPMETSIGTPVGLELASGASLSFDARYELMEFETNSAELFVVASKYCLPLKVWYSRTNGKAVLTSISDVMTCRQQNAMEMLECIYDEVLGNADETLEILKTYTESPHHYLRWSAVKALCAIDYDMGEQFLLSATHDPHPDIKASALKAIAEMEG